MFDANKDGTVSCKELSAVTTALGMKLTEAQLAELMRKADSNHDSRLTFEEFMTMLRTLPKQKMNDALLLSAFKKYDLDKDGFVTGRELRDVMRSVGEELTDDEVSTMISAADSDGDGRVNYQEFLKLLKS